MKDLIIYIATHMYLKYEMNSGKAKHKILTTNL